MVKSRNCDIIDDEDSSMCVLSLSWDLRRNVPRKIIILENVSSLPIWQPENSVIIWNLLWLSSQLIIWTEPKNIYTSTLPLILKFLKWEKSRDKCTLFRTNAILALYHVLPKFRRKFSRRFGRKFALHKTQDKWWGMIIVNLLKCLADVVGVGWGL